MAERFISLKEIQNRISLSKTHIYRLINARKFPASVPLGPHRVAFVESEIEAWMADRRQSRDEDEGAQAPRERAKMSEWKATHVAEPDDHSESVRDDV